MSEQDMKDLYESTKLGEYYIELAEQLAYEQAMEDILYWNKD